MPYLSMASATVRPIAESDLQDMLVPALACLPVAFVSPQPPPSFLSLLSPILRQRIHLSASTNDQSNLMPSQRDTWLSQLTWSRDKASDLADAVGSMQLEAHPVSGEIELFSDGTDAGKVWYKRLDAETVQARCDVPQHKVGFVWTWCERDTGGTGLEALQGGAPTEAKSGWRISEVLPLGSSDSASLDGWYQDLVVAQEHIANLPAQPLTNGTMSHSELAVDNASEDGDDDYWAAYDRTPGKGSRQASIDNMHQARPNGLHRMNSDDYYSRYGNEVQPAMDNHDPDEEAQQTLANGVPQQQEDDTSNGLSEWLRRESRTRSDTLRPGDQPDGMHASEGSSKSHAQPTAAAAQDPVWAAVASLEAQAASNDAVETTVRQHISGEIKNLYRLARGVGMDHEDFKQHVSRELELVGLLGL